MPAVTDAVGCPVQIPYRIDVAPQMGDEMLLMALALVAAVIALLCTRAQRRK
jgi:hypothetical protein